MTDSAISQPATPSTPSPPGPAEAALTGRDDLTAYGPNARLLFVAELRLEFDDVDSFAAECLTDNSNDKKCDLVFVSRSLGRVILAQSYSAQSSNRGASTNKTSDLNTALSWLLTGETSGLPQPLRGAAEEVRSAITDGEIQHVLIWAVHNRDEVDALDQELTQVKTTADALLHRNFPAVSIDVTVEQIGNQTLENDYKTRQSPILVTDDIDLKIRGGFEVSGPEWRAYCTAISAKDLRDIWARYQTRLLSPNIRDYLGVRKSEQNINYGIKQTAKDQPGDFLVFNNGVTGLVNNYTLRNEGSDQILTISGLGIVNGGQTTGALGTLNDTEAEGLENAWVQVRFVTSANQPTIRDVVKYNNTQNKVEAADFRSNDLIQDRLRTEFVAVPDAEYRGGRRGGSADPIKREKFLLPDSTVVQALAAFHGQPNLAYNETREIWVNDVSYSQVFNESVTASHIVMCYGLMKAIEQTKLSLSRIPESNRTSAQKSHVSFFSARGSIALMTSAWGACIETVLDKAVANRFDLKFNGSISPQVSAQHWAPIVSVGLAFSPRLRIATDQGLKSRTVVDNALQEFGELIEATTEANQATYGLFRSQFV